MSVPVAEGDRWGRVMKKPAEVLPHSDTGAKKSAEQTAQTATINGKNDAKHDKTLPAPAALSGKCWISEKIGPDIGAGCSDCWCGLVQIAPPAGANRSTRWGKSLHPLGQIAAPRPPRGNARLGRANRAAGHQPLHPCRPSSVLMPTSIGVGVEPVHSLLYLSSSSFFYLPMGYPSRPHPSARWRAAFRPGFSPPDSVPWWQTTPWSPRWLIGRGCIRGRK